MGRKEDNIKKATLLMSKPESIRNIGTAAHIDHGKTTFSDNLVAGAGMMSEELAGKQRFMDFDEQEAARGITINAANASMVHSVGGKEYLLNLIDTPGHVDFGGDVTRAMRALDGVYILTCAVEGMMPQTETVIRQALKERVRPMLFVNKVDRMINELQITQEAMIEKFSKIVAEVNKRIFDILPAPLNKEWQVKIEDGTVAFGSAYHNWAISAPFMKKSGITFKDVFNYLKEGKSKELSKKSPLHEVILDMAINHTPNPLIAQKRRIPVIWKGDLESDIGKQMLSCDKDGEVSLMVNKIIVDPHAGEVAIGRLFSGTVKRGQTLYISGISNPQRVQTVALSVGADRIPVDECCAGNIVAVSGLRDAVAGSTVSSLKDMEPFEKMTHYSEPVVTKAIEAKHMKDLPKLVEVLRSVAKADPSLNIEINNDTGEHLLSGMGELHLEITEYRILNDHGVEIISSAPIVVYQEGIKKKAGPFEGKSPNKHNKFYFEVEPLEQGVIDAIKRGDIDPGAKIKDPKATAKILSDFGMDKEEAKGIVAFKNNNVLIDTTKGIQYLHETMELVKQSFEESMAHGPLASEKVAGVKIRLMDAKLHEDTIHRGPAQVIPAVRQGIYGAMCLAGRALREPMQKVFISVPQDYMGDAVREVQSRRGIILDMGQEDINATVSAKCPVSEMFGFASAIRGATQGRALWSTENAGFEQMPNELQDKVVKEIRVRKGLNPEPYDAGYYSA
ncbi:MAG: elongation factor EF-2 [Methanomassiliicoccaceae archaeon]|jgi:elongation factor 2|nr:elongation factor EF-2 [Methanomassiliicoccaceae archaeon]